MNEKVRRSRPSQDLQDRQRAAKLRWRSGMVMRPFAEKVAIVLEMQRHLYPVLRARRTLQWWERPWTIES